MNKTKLIIHERFNGKQTLDDGFSGLNFERPEFQRMLKDGDNDCLSFCWKSRRLNIFRN